MILLNPAWISQEQVIASNAALSLYSAWSAATHYAVGQRVHHRASGDSLTSDWQAVAASNNVAPGTSDTHWKRIGASNRFAAFDGAIGVATAATGTVSLTARPGIVANGLGVFGMRGNTVRVEVIDPVDGLVYDRTRPLQDFTQINSMYAYYFEPLRALADAVFLDLPNYRSADVRVTVDAGPGNPAEIGEIVFGTQRPIGQTLFGGTSVSIRDFSRKERDEFGAVRVVERRFIKVASYDVAIPTQNNSAVQQALAELRARPTVYVGSPDHPETIVLGFLTDFSLPITNPTSCRLSLEVEGLI